MFDQLKALEEAGSEAGSLQTGYGYFRRAIAATTADQLAATAAYTWSRIAPKVFAFVPDLVGLLCACGFRIWLISGSPQEIIAVAAAHLGADAWCGAALSPRDDRGVLPELPGDKTKALDLLIGDTHVDLERSFAMGDSVSDAEIFTRLGCPVAFESNPLLAALARRNGWPTADRHTILQLCERLIGAGIAAEQKGHG